ncbi:UNKNOWN [Stylonychia lemnae]|uniref:Uncharacterized protein n=1 Tax=Stylonychia lemnae TaxID=5949 RepID=A0A077ZVP5_STYLE|nr:UNKNOWN [Stylonychia lemnae]|eukprot:CDW73315.1 UNKNOWN [Stylonychia lemnae]
MKSNSQVKNHAFSGVPSDNINSDISHLTQQKTPTKSLSYSQQATEKLHKKNFSENKSQHHLNQNPSDKASTHIDDIHRENCSTDDSYVKNSHVISIMTQVISKFDGRIRLIEENQNKIANSLSRFLDKMNSLLFKENNGKKNSDLDHVALQRGLFPNFAEELIASVGMILNTQSLIEVVNIMQQKPQKIDQDIIIGGGVIDQKSQTQQIQPLTNNYMQYPLQMDNDTSPLNVAQSFNQLPFKQILQEQSNSNLHQTPLSKHNSSSASGTNKNGLNRSYTTIKQLNEAHPYSAQNSNHLLSEQTESKKDDITDDGKSSPREGPFIQNTFQKAAIQKHQQVTPIGNRDKSSKQKNNLLSPSANLSTSNSQASFQIGATSQTSRQTTTSQAQGANHRYDNKRQSEFGGNQHTPINVQIDFQNRENKNNQGARVKIDERHNDKSKTRQAVLSQPQILATKDKDSANQANNNRPKSTTRPAQQQQNNLNKKSMDKMPEKQPPTTTQMATQKTNSRVIQQQQNQQRQNNTIFKGQTTAQKQNTLQNNRSPRDDVSSQYSSVPNTKRGGIHSSPKAEVNQALIQQQDKSANKVPKKKTQVESHPNILSKIQTSDFELQKPSRASIYNGILVEDQSNSKPIVPAIGFKDMTGDILDCIQEMTGEEFPQFAFSNKQILSNYLVYQSENLQLQKEMIDDQIEELRAESGVDGKSNKEDLQFYIPEDLFEKQDILEDLNEWENLLKDLQANKITLKEITVLRIYFTFLNFKNTSPQDCDNKTFLKNVTGVIKKNMQVIDKLCKPELYFKFNDEIKYRAMELMMKVDLNELIQAKFSPLVESMLFVVVEAVQHLDNIKALKESSGEEEDTEINTLEFVKENFAEKLDLVRILQCIIKN